MSAEHLETLLPTLHMLDPADVDAPSLPIAVALQEAVDLAKVVEQPETRERLLAVGLHVETLDQLPISIGAAREAQARWVLVRDGAKSPQQTALEAQGARLRTRVARACRWNLRGRPQATATLEAILAGDGLPDLIQDLLDLAGLVEAQPDAFANDSTFDPVAAAADARAVAHSISEGLSEARADQAKRDAKLLRDRAYTHLDDQVSSIRAAGRYAFADEATTLSRFRSAHRRRLRRRSSEPDVLDVELAPSDPEPPQPAP